MKKFLLNFDRYGYNIGIDDVTNLDQKQIETMVAGYHNREPGYIENLSGSWNVEESENIETLEKRESINDCAIAWHNGMDRCQCFDPDCPRYGIE